MQIRAGRPEDIDFILALEARPDYADLILQWDGARHRAGLDDPDIRYLIGHDEGGAPQGFVLLCGATNPHRSVELKRVAVVEPGAGRGRALLKAAIRLAFEQLAAHRLWLDVVVENQRAAKVYRALGFQEEGVSREACWLAGRFRSLRVMSMLDSEYRAAQSRGFF